jgi:hypothetical protein
MPLVLMFFVIVHIFVRGRIYALQSNIEMEIVQYCQERLGENIKGENRISSATEHRALEM